MPYIKRYSDLYRQTNLYIIFQDKSTAACHHYSTDRDSVQMFYASTICTVPFCRSNGRSRGTDYSTPLFLPGWYTVPRINRDAMYPADSVGDQNLPVEGYRTEGPFACTSLTMLSKATRKHPNFHQGSLYSR